MSKQPSVVKSYSVKKAKTALRSMYNWTMNTKSLTPEEKASYVKLLIALGNDLSGAYKRQTIDEIISLGNHLIDSKLNTVRDALEAEIIKIKR